VVQHPVVKEKYPILMQAAELVASPQIRNQGTLGGMFRRTRGAGITATAGPAIAPAATFATPTPDRHQTVSMPSFDANRCVAVNPSDTAPL